MGRERGKKMLTENHRNLFQAIAELLQSHEVE
jgi:hypothetical protein